MYSLDKISPSPLQKVKYSIHVVRNHSIWKWFSLLRSSILRSFNFKVDAHNLSRIEIMGSLLKIRENAPNLTVLEASTRPLWVANDHLFSTAETKTLQRKYLVLFVCGWDVWGFAFMTRIWLILGDTALDEMFLALLCQHFLQVDSHSQRCFFHNIDSSLMFGSSLCAKHASISFFPVSSDGDGQRWKIRLACQFVLKQKFHILSAHKLVNILTITAHCSDGHHLHHHGHHHHHHNHHRHHHQIAVMGFILLSGLAKLVFHRAHWLSSRVILIIMIILMMMRMMQILGTLSFLQGNNND